MTNVARSATVCALRASTGWRAKDRIIGRVEGLGDGSRCRRRSDDATVSQDELAQALLSPHIRKNNGSSRRAVRRWLYRRAMPKVVSSDRRICELAMREGIIV